MEYFSALTTAAYSFLNYTDNLKIVSKFCDFLRIRMDVFTGKEFR